MKKQLYILCSILFTSLIGFSQNEVKVTEQNESFNVGSKNAIVATIPYGKKDVVEKMIKKELKDWNGKYDSKGGEFFVIQAVSKFMGEKAFDTYVKIVSDKEGDFRVAFATDLGGAYLTSSAHGEQFKAMREKVKSFAKEAASKCIEEDIDSNKDKLSDLEKKQASLEKEKKSLEQDIEDYKKKIAQAEDKIKANEKSQEAQKEAIKTQQTVVSDIEKRLKAIK